MTGTAWSGRGALGRRGRVACGFARLTSAARVEPVVSTVMGVPCASFAPFYLRGRYKDYSSAEPATQLAGRKRYLPRFPAGTAAGAERAINDQLREQIDRIERDSRKPLSDKVKSRLSFLLPGAGSASCAFPAISGWTMSARRSWGAVLWVLTHGGDPAKPYRHMMAGASRSARGRCGLTACPSACFPTTRTPAGG